MEAFQALPDLVVRKPETVAGIEDVGHHVRAGALARWRHVIRSHVLLTMSTQVPGDDVFLHDLLRHDRNALRCRQSRNGGTYRRPPEVSSITRMCTVAGFTLCAFDGYGLCGQ